MKRGFFKDYSRTTVTALGIAIFSAALTDFGAFAAPEKVYKEPASVSQAMSKVVVPNLTISEFENTSDFGFWLGGITYYPGSNEYITQFKKAFPLKGVIVTPFGLLNAKYTIDAQNLLKTLGVQSVIQSTPSSIQTPVDSRFQYEVAGVSNGSGFLAFPPQCYSTLGATKIVTGSVTPDSTSCNSQSACTMRPGANCCEPSAYTPGGSCTIGDANSGNGNVTITDPYYSARVDGLAVKAAPDSNAFGSSMADMYLPNRALHQGLPGYSTLSISAFRNDLQGTDEGLKVKYPSTNNNNSFVMKFADYAFRYLGRYPKDAFPQYCPGAEMLNQAATRHTFPEKVRLGSNFSSRSSQCT